MRKGRRSEIVQVEPRKTVQIHLPGGEVLEGARGTQLEAFLKDLSDEKAPIVGAVLNRELRELTYSVQMDGEVRPVTMAEADGMRIYRRSNCSLMRS